MRASASPRSFNILPVAHGFSLVTLRGKRARKPAWPAAPGLRRRSSMRLTLSRRAGCARRASIAERIVKTAGGRRGRRTAPRIAAAGAGLNALRARTRLADVGMVSGAQSAASKESSPRNSSHLSLSSLLENLLRRSPLKEENQNNSGGEGGLLMPQANSRRLRDCHHLR